MAHYCNTTTDLRDVYAQIEEYASTRFPLKDFEVYSAGGSIYNTYNPGHVEKLFEDGISLTGVSAIASVDAVSKFYYDSTNDILYVRSSDSADPDIHEMEKGFDWNTIKTTARNDAEDLLDGMLDHKFPRPIPEARQYHGSRSFDFALVRATALTTCANILNQYGAFDTSEQLMKQVVNDENNGIIDRYNDGRLRFSWEVTPDELGKYNIEADSTNTGDGFIELTGKYGGSADVGDVLIDWDLKDEVWLIEIDGAGATKTATFKWSRDNGVSFEATTKTTDEEWISLGAGVSIRFWDRDGDFDSGDKWVVFMQTERREDQVIPPTIILRG